MAEVKVSEALLRAMELELKRQAIEASEYGHEFVIPPPSQTTIAMDKWAFWALLVVSCKSLDIPLLQDLIKEGEEAFPELEISERYLSLLMNLFKSCSLNPDKPHKCCGDLKVRQMKESQMAGFLLSRCKRLYVHSQRYSRKIGQPDVWHYLGYAALTGNVLIVLRSIMHMARMGEAPYRDEVAEAWAVSCYFGFDDIVKLLAGLIPRKSIESTTTYSYCRSQKTMSLVLQLFPDSYPWWSVQGLLQSGALEGLRVFLSQHILAAKDLPGSEIISRDTSSSWWKLVVKTYQEVRGRYPNFLELAALHYDESLVPGFIETFLDAGVDLNAKGVYHPVQNLLSRESQLALGGIRVLTKKANSLSRLEFDSLVDLNAHKALVTQVMIEFPEKVTIGKLNDKLLKAFTLNATKLQSLATRLQLGTVDTLDFHQLHVLIFCYQLALECESAEDVAVMMYQAAQRSKDGVIGESKRLGRYDNSHINSVKDMYSDLIWKTLVPKLLTISGKQNVVARYQTDPGGFEKKLSAMLATAVLFKESDAGLVIRRPSLVMSLSERYHDVGFRITASGHELSDEGEWEAIHPAWKDSQTGITFEPVVTMSGLQDESRVHNHCIGLTGTYRNMCCNYKLQVYRLLKGSTALTTLGIAINESSQISVYGNSGYKNRPATAEERSATEQFIAKIKASNLPEAFVVARDLVLKCARLSQGTTYEQMVSKMTADPLSAEEAHLFNDLSAKFFQDNLSPYRLPNTTAIDAHGQRRDTRQRLLTAASYEFVVEAARTWLTQEVPVLAT